MTPEKMAAVQLTGHGGFEMLNYRTDIDVPKPQTGEVLIRIAAAGINNTDVNTRIGWYSKSVETGTSEESIAATGSDDAGWAGVALQLPRIQGADICGHIINVGEGVDSARIGDRVLVRSMMQMDNPFECETMGSERDGGFAQYACAPAHETYKVECDWTDAELASIPCAYSTAENLLHRVGLGAEHVLITGASGGVGSAAIQLAKRRGARIFAVASKSKHKALLDLGADEVFDRNDDLVSKLGENCLDVVVDVVAGETWPDFLKLLKRGARYVTAGAIAGPLVKLDVRTLYLKDLTLMGCTYQEAVVFENLIGYIERGEIKPLVSKTFPLSEIVKAQKEFLQKKYVGKMVLIPPA